MEEIRDAPEEPRRRRTFTVVASSVGETGGYYTGLAELRVYDTAAARTAFIKAASRRLLGREVGATIELTLREVTGNGSGRRWTGTVTKKCHTPEEIDNLRRNDPSGRGPPKMYLDARFTKA